MTASLPTIDRLEDVLNRPEGSQDPAERSVLLHIAADRLMMLTRHMLRGYPRLRRWEETDDVFQEATLRLYRSLNQVSPKSTEEFFGLAALQIRRTLIDLARHHFGPHGDAGRHHSDPLILEREPSERSHGGRSGEPQSLEEWTAFHEAVGALPDRERDVFELIWYAGATYQDAAKMLGITRRTAIRRMNRARLRLRSHVDESDL